MVMGRPTDYRPEYCDQVVSYLSDGKHIIQFANHIGVAKATIYRWAEEHDDFRDALKRAKEASLSVWLDNAKAKAFGEKKEGSDALLIYMLKVKDPEEFGEKNHYQQPRDDASEILNTCSPETLSAIGRDIQAKKNNT